MRSKYHLPKTLATFCARLMSVTSVPLNTISMIINLIIFSSQAKIQLLFVIREFQAGNLSNRLPNKQSNRIGSLDACEL
jgi:hypothetical protein